MLQKGIVKTVTFYNPENGYSVLKLITPDSDKSFTAVGIFPHLSEGENLELQGDWVVHTVYGQQFKSTACKVLPPDNVEGIMRYLAGGIFKGVGPAQAKCLAEAFGMNTFDVLDHHPDRLKEVRSLGKKKRENLLFQWNKNRSARDVMYFLQAYGLSLNLSTKIHNHYGDDAVTIIKKDPYKLADDIWGIGFLKADEIAKKMGFREDSYERIKAGLVYALNRSAEEGHVYLNRDELLQNTEEILKCSQELIIYTLDNLADSNVLYRDQDDCFYRPYLFYSETGICRKLVELIKSEKKQVPAHLLEQGIKNAETTFTREFGKKFLYLEEQKKGIRLAIQSGVFLLTGGPGTGKTTTLRGILQVLKQSQFKIYLAAPTGRAAKRMSEITKKNASTIHRLLQYEPDSNSFFYNESNPLKADAVIIDEVSMIDTVLMYGLLRAITPGVRLIFVGDKDQLPSVGPGKVLSELIASGTVPTLNLHKIVRQEESSRIVTNAHRINRGQMPELHQHDDQFNFQSCPHSTGALEMTVDLVCRQLPRRFGYDPIRDIQVLTPMNRGPLGTQVLNHHLQDILNPTAVGLSFKEIHFKKGDKVMQLKNNYDKNVFNGDTGIVQSVDCKNRSMEILFDRLTHYDHDDLDQLNLAYAITIHKSQGSEYRAAVILLTNNHYIMLQRNLFYTAVTRAKERVFLLATINAVQRAVENNPGCSKP
jgi:exodeoxyribonuclease V alpha subunit